MQAKRAALASAYIGSPKNPKHITIAQENKQTKQKKKPHITMSKV